MAGLDAATGRRLWLKNFFFLPQVPVGRCLPVKKKKSPVR